MRKQYADGQGTNYTYTPGGKLKTQTNARGTITTYAYDHAGQPTAVTANDHGVTPPQSLTFDQWGRFSAIETEGVALYTYIYNNQGQLIKEDISLPSSNGSLNRSIERLYDALGRSSGYRIKQGDHVEQEIAYTYNSSGQLSSVTADGKNFTYDYVQNAPQLLAEMTSPVHTVINMWDPVRDILINKTNAWKNKMDKPVISSYTYTVNSLGQRTSVATAGEVFTQSTADWTWGYDVLGQVTQANENRYAYDRIGNRLTSGKFNEILTNYTTNALNQYTALNTVQPTYDADGNLLTGLTPVTDNPNRASLAFTYNANNRLIEVRQNGELKELRAYDHKGRRVLKGETFTLYDGYNAIAEYNLNTRTLKTTFAWGNDLSGSLQGAGGVGGLLSVTEHDRQLPLTSYPSYDGNGNITEYMEEENSGILTIHYEYDTFGNVITKTGEKEYEYQFSTKPYDLKSGLLYYNHRSYDSTNGQWIARDRLEEMGGVNLYAFAFNDPIDRIDLLGESSSGNGDDCTKYREHLEKKQKDYAGTIKDIKEKGCEISFECQELEGNILGYATRTDSTWWPFSSIKILIVLNCCTGANQPMNSSEDTFGHEMEHAKDQCYGTMGSGCAGSICTEIKGYTVGGCKGLRGEQLKECLRRRVPGSSTSHCEGEDMNKIFEENYEKCIKDMPH